LFVGSGFAKKLSVTTEGKRGDDTTISQEVTHMVEQLYSIRDCGKAVGVAAHKIAYAHAQERLAEPQYRIAGKRIYTAEDVRRVAKYFEDREERRRKGRDGR
jgi:hypothetical protein